MNQIFTLIKKLSITFFLSFIIFIEPSIVYGQAKAEEAFAVKGFHLDMKIQVMRMPALKKFVKKLHDNGINTLIMEWGGTYPFLNHPLISNRFAYTRDEIVDFMAYCNSLKMDVIPLQQSFGHVEYILKHYKYKELRESNKDFSQVNPLKEDLNRALFTDLFKDMVDTHPSQYFHIGGDETTLLGYHPASKEKIEAVGVGRLYGDYIKLLCDIVTSLGKTPVLWADIALKYPDALQQIPKGTVFVDWNYGWNFNRFGKHENLLNSGFEIWGAPAIRSAPDNFYLTCWTKHFQNLADFIPAARSYDYKGMVVTSWSTSGFYTTVWESNSEVLDMYSIRRVYPITGFNILIDAYFKAINDSNPLDISGFVADYTRERFGFNENENQRFWQALTKTPFEIERGVVNKGAMTTANLRDSALIAAKELHNLKPAKNIKEFKHYQLMADIRAQYLTYMELEVRANSTDFTRNDIPGVLLQLKSINTADIDKRFIALNKDTYYMAELVEENELRNKKIKMLYDRLANAREN